MERHEFEADIKHEEILLQQRQQQLEQEENNWQLQRNEEIYQQQLFKRKENHRRKEEDIERRAQKMKQKKKNTDLLIKNNAPTSISRIEIIPNDTNKWQITTEPQATTDILIEIVHTTTRWMQPQNSKEQPFLRQQRHRTQQKAKPKQTKLIRPKLYNFADLLKSVIAIIDRLVTRRPILNIIISVPSSKENPNLFSDHPT